VPVGFFGVNIPHTFRQETNLQVHTAYLDYSYMKLTLKKQTREPWRNRLWSSP